MSASYQTCQNARAAAEACAGHIVTVLEAALACQELATLAVSGGTSPRWMFERLGDCCAKQNRPAGCGRHELIVALFLPQAARGRSDRARRPPSPRAFL